VTAQSSDPAISSTDERHRRWLWIGLGAGLIVHLALLPTQGFTGDLQAFDSWMRAAIAFGATHVYEHVFCDYLPGYLYLTKGVGLLWTIVTRQPLPPFHSVAQRMLLKVIPALADLAGAWVLYRIGRTRRQPALAAAIGVSYALNPAMLFTSAVWGQVDSLLALLLLLAVWSISCAQSAIGFALLTATMLIKPQAVALVPMLALGALCVSGARVLIVAPLASGLTAAALLLPFVAAGQMAAVWSTVSIIVGHFSAVSMNAHNVWWLIWGRASPNTSDMMRFGNALLSYRALGMIMLGVATLLILWRLSRALRARATEPLPALCEAGALQMFAFYLFPTEMHERYIVPALIFLAATALWQPRLTWVYGLTSATTLLSLTIAFPTFTPALRSSHAAPYVVSVLFVTTFLLLLFWTSDRRFRDLAPIVLLLSASATLGIAILPLTSSQRLCDWSPIGWEQGWGAVQIDRSVEGRPLSVAGRTFAHGLGTRAPSRISYHLNGAFRTFESALGVDDEANHGQTMRFRVVVDRYVLYDSGDVSGPDTLRQVTIPVDGAQYLSLVVLDGGDGITSDHADWLEPVLQR